jgi:hypothetical protein
MDYDDEPCAEHARLDVGFPAFLGVMLPALHELQENVAKAEYFKAGWNYCQRQGTKEFTSPDSSGKY